MFTLKIGGGTPSPFVVALASLGPTLARVKISGASTLSQGPKYSLPKSTWMGPYSCATLWIVDQSSPDGLVSPNAEESFSIKCLSDFGYLDSLR